MKTTLTFIGTNSALDYLRDKSFDAEIHCLNAIAEENSNMHVIKTPDSEYLFDLKDTKVLDFVVLQGILQDGESVGRVAIQLQ